MIKKKIKPEAIEQAKYQVFNPENIKQTVEIAVKPKPRIEDIEIIEKKSDRLKPKKKTKEKLKKPSLNKKEPARFVEKKLVKDGYTLIITEKPQAALKIAAALADNGERKKSDNGIPYYELERNKKNIIVACAVGHLFTVYQTKKGSNYPIFDVGWFPNFEVKKKDFTKKYYFLLSKLVKRASEIIVATDFDTEGEVIGYNIIRFIANQKDARRMKFSSLTVKELQESFDNSLPTIEWGQAIAGETRHFLDWLYGINLSRAIMDSIKKVGKFKIMSMGRVQGPTLNLIVKKEKEIQNFKSTPYWQIFLDIYDGKNKTEVKYEKDITKKQELNKFNDLKGKECDAKTTKTKEVIMPPPPFDLTTLQTETYKFHSITPSQTLSIAQKLYLAGLISYPRTSSQKIPESMEPRKILEKLSKSFDEVKNATRKNPVEGKKTDPAHPAIIPTGQSENLEGDEEKLYNLIVKRFVSCFCEDGEIENKKLEVIVDNMKFFEKGMEIIKHGWLNVYPTKMNEKEIKDFNGKVKVMDSRIEEKMTQPPKRYSPASIVSELEKRNLGTKATRANIIETLYDRDYIKEKSIQATELGIRLIDTMQKYSGIIIDEKLTREIENDMENMRSSKKDLDKKETMILKKAEESLKKIASDFKKHELQIGKELVEANEALWEKQKEDNKLGIKCPACKNGDLTIKFSPRFRNYFVACSSYPDCRQTFSLPSRSLIKKTDKVCEECKWPMLLSIRKGKRPWIFCFNKICPGKKPIDIDGNVKTSSN